MRKFIKCGENFWNIERFLYLTIDDRGLGWRKRYCVIGLLENDSTYVLDEFEQKDEALERLHEIVDSVWQENE